MFNKKVTVIVSIEGMKCEHCANKIKNALADIKEIKKIKIDLSRKEVILISDKSIDQNELKEIISNLGYQVIEIIEKV